MALSFDGVNDDATNANGVTGLTGDTRSWAAWVYYRSSPGAGATEIIDRLLDDIPAVQNSHFGVNARPPGTTGWLARLTSGHDTAPGVWDYATDLSLNTWYHLCWTYDQALTTNDPILYVNGASVALTETQTPSGPLVGTMDSLAMGSTGSANYGDFIIDQRGWWNRILTAAEALRLSNGERPATIASGLVQHHDMENTGILGRALTGEALTIAGASFVPGPGRVWMNPALIAGRQLLVPV